LQIAIDLPLINLVPIALEQMGALLEGGARGRIRTKGDNFLGAASKIPSWARLIGQRTRGKPLERRHLSQEEIEERLSALVHSEWLRLVRFARALTATDAEDLAQTACLRVLEGGRGWPRDVSTLAFLFNVMRSVADQWHSKGKLPIFSIDGMSAGQIQTVDLAAASPLTPERHLAAREELKEIEALFEDDQNATWVLIGLEDDVASNDIQELAGMSLQEYEAARKRVARRLMRYERGGSKNAK
jgi:DNA-directed RNA polymerase specialized sigma24 family protein